MSDNDIIMDDVEYGSLFRRISAFMIDLFILFIFIGFIFMRGLNTSNLVISLIIIFISFGIVFCYFFYFEGPVSGSTPGKQVLSLKVVDQETLKPITYSQSFIRNILRIIDLFPYIPPGIIGIITILLTDKKQRIGDKAAKTIIVHKNIPNRLSNNTLK